ncbi:MAG: hypothetical protein K9L30_04195 [Desulfobacterales bacterium]|nr:hypothetical protein [Desulfobacterales bacterium]
MDFFSIEFWVICQMVIDLIIIGMILYFFRTLQAATYSKNLGVSVKHITSMLEPILKETHTTAKEFDIQLREKKRLIKELNEKLESRIISLNLLLNRADEYLKRADKIKVGEQLYTNDYQSEIIQLYEKGFDAEAIGNKVSMPTGEVELVINLKKKFAELAQ